MTRRHLYRWTSIVIGIYSIVMFIGIGLIEALALFGIAFSFII